MNFLSRLLESKEAKAERLNKEVEARRLAEEAEKKRQAAEAEKQRIAREAERRNRAEEAEKNRIALEAEAKEKLLERALKGGPGVEGITDALQELNRTGDSRLIEALTEIRVSTVSPPDHALFDVVVSLAEKLGVDGVPALTKHLNNNAWANDSCLARGEKCARALVRIGKPECEAALEVALRDAEERKRVNSAGVFTRIWDAQGLKRLSPAGAFTEHLVNALESFRDPERAAKREKREAENDQLILIVQPPRRHSDMVVDERITAIRKLVASGDSRTVRVLARVFDEQDFKGRVQDAALAELERIGLEAIPALAHALGTLHGPSAKAAMTLARLGDASCEAILEAERREHGSKYLVDALQLLRDPTTARAREEREAKHRAIHERQVDTENPDEAVKTIFREMLAIAPVLTSSEIHAFFRDWAGEDASSVSLQPSQSVEACESYVRTHLNALRNRNGFETFRVELKPRWKCIFVSTFYSGVVNMLLVWRQQDGCVVAHT